MENRKNAISVERRGQKSRGGMERAELLSSSLHGFAAVSEVVEFMKEREASNLSSLVLFLFFFPSAAK